jgi:intracellular sulfur oxidation DsrE/DsrF family protein
MRALILRAGLLIAVASLITFASPTRAADARHHLLVHVDSPDPDVMVEALHNATNAIDTVRKRGSTVAVEIVANGRGTVMFVETLSPVTDEIRRIHAAYPDLVMSACAISLSHIEAARKEKLTVMPDARIVPSGAVRIMELEERHWAYLKP